MASFARVARPPFFLASSDVLAASLESVRTPSAFVAASSASSLGAAMSRLVTSRTKLRDAGAARAHPAREAGAALVERVVAQLLLDAQRALDAGGRHPLPTL